MTEKQRHIFNYAKQNGGMVTKKEAVLIIGQFYYCNAGKHVGELLHRMVQSNLLERVKQGHYKVKNHVPIRTESDANQIQLFV